MYCPKCGQQQLMESASFCFKCGFALDGLKRLLKGNGVSLVNPPNSASQEDMGTIFFPVPTRIEDMERRMIISTLNSTGGNKTRTAELLGISLKTLHNKLTLYRTEGRSQGN
jgi:DNA-binding NtrC family response regulator